MTQYRKDRIATMSRFIETQKQTLERKKEKLRELEQLSISVSLDIDILEKEIEMLSDFISDTEEQIYSLETRE